MSIACVSGQTVNADDQEVLSLAWPVMAQNLLRTLILFVETLLMGWLGERALAAMGVSAALMWSLTSVLGAISVAALSTVARAHGEGDARKTALSAAGALLGAIAVGLLVAVACLANLRSMVRVFTQDDAIVELAVPFLQVAFTALPATVVAGVAASVLRAAGDTRTPMWIMGASNVTGILASVILIFGCGLGMLGAGIGAGLASVLDAVLLCGWLFTPASMVRLSASDFYSIDLATVRRLLTVGLPGAIEPFIVHTAFLLFTAMVASLGPAAMAAYRLSVAIESLGYLPGTGFEVASSSLVGRRLGAEQPAAAARALSSCTRLALLSMSAVGLVQLLWPSAMASVFTGDPHVLSLACTCLMIGAFTQPLKAVAFTAQGALRGAGDTRSTALVALLGSWAVRIPAVWLLTRVLSLGLAGVWVAVLLDWAVRAILLRLRATRGASIAA